MSFRKDLRTLMKTPRSKLRGIKRKITLDLLEASFGESHPKRFNIFNRLEKFSPGIVVLFKTLLQLALAFGVNGFICRFDLLVGVAAADNCEF